MILDPAAQPIGTTLSEAQAVELMTAELQALERDPMQIVLRPITALQVAGLLQLTLRHPDLSAANREAAWNFVEAIREYFAESPTILLILEAGDDPTQDV